MPLTATDRPPKMSVTDHRVGLRGGTTIALEASGESLKRMGKEHVPLARRIEELTRMIGALRMEVQYYRDLHSHAKKLSYTAGTVFQELQLAFYQDGISKTNALDRCYELSVQLHDALDRYHEDENTSEGDWLTFWTESGDAGEPRFI